MPAPITSPPPRSWVKDALSAIAFFGLALAATKAAWRALGPFGGLFFLATTGGIGWVFARSAWRGLLQDRSTQETNRRLSESRRLNGDRRR